MFRLVVLCSLTLHSFLSQSFILFLLFIWPFLYTIHILRKITIIIRLSSSSSSKHVIFYLPMCIVYVIPCIQCQCILLYITQQNKYSSTDTQPRARSPAIKFQGLQLVSHRLHPYTFFYMHE